MVGRICSSTRIIYQTKRSTPKARENLVAVAKEWGIVHSKIALIKQGRYAHVKQHNRACRELIYVATIQHKPYLDVESAVQSFFKSWRKVGMPMPINDVAID